MGHSDLFFFCMCTHPYECDICAGQRDDRLRRSVRHDDNFASKYGLTLFRLVLSSLCIHTTNVASLCFLHVYKCVVLTIYRNVG